MAGWFLTSRQTAEFTLEIVPMNISNVPVPVKDLKGPLVLRVRVK